MSKAYVTAADAAMDVREALGDFAGDYDVDAIVADLYEWRGGRLARVHEPDDETGEDPEFWEIVARHDASATERDPYAPEPDDGDGE